MSGMLSGGYAIELWRAEDAPDYLESRLLDEVWVQLHREPGLDTTAITVQVPSGGVAKIEGTVASHAEKLAAARATGRARGIGRVIDGIRVRADPR